MDELNRHPNAPRPLGRDKNERSRLIHHLDEAYINTPGLEFDRMSLLQVPE